MDVVGIARSRRREAVRIGAEGCEENDLIAPTLRNSTRELLFWLAIRRLAENQNRVALQFGPRKR